MLIDVDDHASNFIDKNIERDSLLIENEMKNYMTTEEGEKIKNDIKLLQDMGYDKKMINKVYILLQPESIERAIDFMSEINGIFQHNYFENHKSKEKDSCFICKKPKRCHLDYIPEYLLNNNPNLNLDNYFENENNNDSFDFFNEEKDNIKKDNLVNNECNVCYEEVGDEEKKFNEIPCGHICCTQCWINYLKTLISEAKVEEIKCVEHECKQIISEDFILKHIKDDQNLIEKYKKFKNRAEIINDKNKKQCPNPDCESYLEKSSTSKYVKCKNGHEYCFDCLKKPHGKNACEDILEKKFLKWKKNKRIKRCPKCKIFIEKNEGCNHMTCRNCKYQWCWLCEGIYDYDHFRSGKCKGQQYTRADNLCLANLCCFTIGSIFPCFYGEFEGIFPIEFLWLRYLCIFICWFFGFFVFAGFSIFNYCDNEGFLYRHEMTIYVMGFLIVICLFVCFQILFSCLITPFILISLIYPNYLDMILLFFNIGH